jgi:hypothetical protein
VLGQKIDGYFSSRSAENFAGPVEKSKA